MANIQYVKKYLMLLFFGLLCGYFSNAQLSEKHTYFSPGSLWLDTNHEHINAHGGGIFEEDGIYYWYGEHKNKNSLAQVGVRVYSSTDLYNWTNEGVALSVSEDPDSEITIGSVIERPKVIYNEKTQNYVMWFHLELKGQGYAAARTGVATSKSPMGPFTYLKSYRPNAGQWPINFSEDQKLSSASDNKLEWWTPEWTTALKNGLYVRRDFKEGQMSRDMTLFVDDDGSAYHIHSSEENQTLHIAELTDDYLGFTGKWARIQPGGQNEAPAIFKKGATYYMITSGLTGWAPNPARSFKATSIFGPWESLGNPAKGKHSNVTFHSQSTFILPVVSKTDTSYIYMGDRWNPKNHIDGRYIWLPLEINNGKPEIKWQDTWQLQGSTPAE